MKNGCCRECMKAFSKTGKVILAPLIFIINHLYLVLFMLSAETTEESYTAIEWVQVLRMQGMQPNRHKER